VLKATRTYNKNERRIKQQRRTKNQKKKNGMPAEKWGRRIELHGKPVDTIPAAAAAAAEAVDNYQKLAMVLDKRPNPNRRGAGKVEQELGQSAKQLAINFPPLFSTQRKQKVEAPPRWAPLENISIHM